MKNRIVFSALLAVFSTATFAAAATVASSASGPLTRECWNTDREKASLVQKKTGELEITLNGKTCDLKVDPSYPNAHVPAAYQSWKRYLSEFSGKDRRNDPCTLALGFVSGPYDSSGNFEELKIDGNVLNPSFKGGASMQVGLAGDGSGPNSVHYICR